MFTINFRTLRLAIRPQRTSDIRAFIPREAEPAERIEYLLFGSGDEAGTVGVLDAQHKLTASLPGVKIVNQADVGSPDVGVAGRARSDADAYGGVGGVRTHCHKGQTLMLAERKGVKESSAKGNNL